MKLLSVSDLIRDLSRSISCHCKPPSFPPPLSSSGHPPFIPGWRRDPGNQRREHQGNEARTSYRAHQERRAPRPSGAQEGRRLGARIWWVNLRKHSLLPNLHALTRGTPVGRAVVGRTVFPSQDPSPVPGHVLRGGGGVCRSWWWSLRAGAGALGALTSSCCNLH